ncbi:MAG: AEC family transporter [Chitinivibrionales bacterium]
MFIINTLAPLVLLVILGAVLRSSRFAPGCFFDNLNRMVYWITLPALLFLKLSQASITWSAAAWLIGLLFGGAMLSLLLARITGALFRLPPPSLSAFMQGAFRGNLAFIGLPVVLFALTDAPPSASQNIETIAVLGLAPTIPLYNIVSVIILMAGRKSAGQSVIGRVQFMAGGVLSNPLVVACIAGITFSFTGLSLPVMLVRPLDLLGRTSLPLALVAIGASLNLGAIKGHSLSATAAGLIKVAVGPLFLFLVNLIIDIPHTEYQIALLYLACPTAVSSFVMAQQLGADDSLVGSIIVISTLLSLPAFILVLSFM